jgi:hypothetical protein
MIVMLKLSPLPVLVLVVGILFCGSSNFMCVCCYSGCLLLNLCDINTTFLSWLTVYLWCHKSGPMQTPSQPWSSLKAYLSGHPQGLFLASSTRSILVIVLFSPLFGLNHDE